MSNSPEGELKRFLARLSPLQRKVLDYDLSFSREEQLEWADSMLTIENQVRPEYERLLRNTERRSLWNRYCRKAKQFHRDLDRDRAKFFKGKPGAPKKDALAQEAALLRRRGMKFPQIAAELNKKHGDGTTTPEAIRKLLERRSNPETSRPDKI